MENLVKKLASDQVRITINGNVAVKTPDGYKYYDLKSKKLVNASQFTMEMSSDLFFLFPSRSVKSGDIIVVNDKPFCVLESTKESNEIKVLSYFDNRVDTIVPERNILFGNFYFFQKVISPMTSMFGKKSGVNSLLKLSMMQSLLGNGSSNPNSASGLLSMNNTGNDLMTTMLMMNMMNGGKNDDPNIFSDMLDDLGFDDFGFDEDKPNEDNPDNKE